MRGSGKTLVRRFRVRYPPEERKMSKIIDTIKKRKIALQQPAPVVESAEVLSESEFQVACVHLCVFGAIVLCYVSCVRVSLSNTPM